MPPFVFTEASVLAVCAAINAVCEVQKLTLENMTPEQKATQAQFFVEALRPGLLLMQGFNRWLEEQLKK